MTALERDLFGNREIVLFRLVPINEMDSLGGFARFDFDMHPVAKKFVDFLIIAVEGTIMIVSFTAEEVERSIDLSRGVAIFPQPIFEQNFFDVAVVGAIRPVAEVTVTQLFAEEG